MQTSDVTYYRIDGSVGNASQQDGFSIQSTSASGMTDAAFLNLAKAIEGVTWPPGITLTLYVSKNDQSTTSSTGDLGSNPAAFV